MWKFLSTLQFHYCSQFTLSEIFFILSWLSWLSFRGNLGREASRKDGLEEISRCGFRCATDRCCSWSELRKATQSALKQKLLQSLYRFWLNRHFSRMPAGKDDGKFWGTHGEKILRAIKEEKGNIFYYPFLSVGTYERIMCTTMCNTCNNIG